MSDILDIPNPLSEICKLAELSAWQNEYLGRQRMVIAVLNWALANHLSVSNPDLFDSLKSTMDAELTTHRAARPQGTP